jgi:hypothetical protein
MENKIELALNSMLNALDKIERTWILNPEADIKHTRREIVDAINALTDGERIDYEFDPANPPARHKDFVEFQLRCGKLTLKAV